MRPGGRTAKLERTGVVTLVLHPEQPVCCPTQSAAASQQATCQHLDQSMFQEIWFSDTEVVLVFFCNGLPGKREQGIF